MKNKGFVLMETIVVIVVISVALLTIFSSYNKILRKVKSENKYDTSEYIYMTNYIKEYLQEPTKCIYPLIAYDIMPTSNFDFPDHYEKDSCGIKTALNNTGFQVKKIYILTNVNKFDNTLDNGKKNSEYFDAYMIDYIRKLDVGNMDELIIVEYGRNAIDNDGNDIYTTKCPNGSTDASGNPCLPLTETYIASLEW